MNQTLYDHSQELLYIDYETRGLEFIKDLSYFLKEISLPAKDNQLFNNKDIRKRYLHANILYSHKFDVI